MSAGHLIEATFCFVDIAGFTALTDTHGELAAADLVDDFSALVRKSIEPEGRLQALIGDCAFLIFPEPVSAFHALARLYESIADRDNFPIIRAGMHHGSALVRDDRHYGTTVNLAARLEQLNKEYDTRILVSDSTRQACGDAFTFQSHGVTVVRGRSDVAAVYSIDPNAQETT